MWGMRRDNPCSWQTRKDPILEDHVSHTKKLEDLKAEENHRGV